MMMDRMHSTINLAEPMSYDVCVSGSKRTYGPTDALPHEILTEDVVRHGVAYRANLGHEEADYARTIRKVSLGAVLEAIRNPSAEQMLNVMRALRSPDVPKYMKGHIKATKLKRIYFGDFEVVRGNFTDAGLKVHAGVACFDADDLTPDMVVLVREMLASDRHTMCTFLSPRGNGLKWLVKIPNVAANHGSHYASLVEYYDAMFLGSLRLDRACSNPSRACFATYDPDLYLKEDSDVWTGMKAPEAPKRQDAIPARERRELSTGDKVDRAIRKVELKHAWTDGTKHTFLVSLVGTCREMDVPYEEFVSACSSYLIDRKAKETARKLYKLKK